MTATQRSVHGTIVAAVLLSAAAHAALVLMGGAAEPLTASSTRGNTVRAVGALHVGLRSIDAPAVGGAPAPSAALTVAHSIATVPAQPPPAPLFTPQRTTPSDAVAAISVSHEPEAAAPSVERPTPITYPILELPADDDPHRVGLVRLMLVVSSEGTVVRAVVTAATLSPDYVERIVHSFEQVRFRPAQSHGLPRASWYEVVVNFDFDPTARTTL